MGGDRQTGAEPDFVPVALEDPGQSSAKPGRVRDVPALRTGLDAASGKAGVLDSGGHRHTLRAAMVSVRV